MRLLTEEITFCPTPSNFDPSDVPCVPFFTAVTIELIKQTE